MTRHNGANVGAIVQACRHYITEIAELFGQRTQPGCRTGRRFGPLDIAETVDLLADALQFLARLVELFQIGQRCESQRAEFVQPFDQPPQLPTPARQGYHDEPRRPP